MSFRKRGYQELVGDVLTELTGGVVNEPVRFTAPDEKPPTFPLAETPVAKIASVTGTVGGEPHPFTDADYELTEDRGALRWLGAARPDEGATLFVDYYPEGAQSPITDRNVGSVARTVVEAIGREIAVLYEQLELVYKSGFLDTAEGTALDFVVALLGLERIRAGRRAGEVSFARSTPAPGDVTVPAGTVVATIPIGEKQQVFEYETTGARTLRQGQSEVAAPIRFRPTPEQEAAFVTGEVAAGAIRLLPKPIVGIETVTNPEATTRGGEDERDEELRRRAKNAMAGAGKSTLDALRAAVLRHGPGVEVVAQELPRGLPGEVRLMISGAEDDERRAAIEQSVLATKAAGVMVDLGAAHAVRVTIKLRLETGEDVELSGEEKGRLEESVRSAVARHLGGLRAGESLKRNALIALALADERFREVAVEELTARREDLVDESANRLLDAAGEPTGVAGFDHLRLGQLEKISAAAEDVEIAVVTGEAEVTTAVRIAVTLRGNLTAAGTSQGTTTAAVEDQVGTLVRGFVEAPERDREVRLVDLIEFIVQGSGLFTLKPHPHSFFVAEHAATGLVDRDLDIVTLGEREQAELESLDLELT